MLLPSTSRLRIIICLSAFKTFATIRLPFLGPLARMKLLGRNLASSRFVIGPAGVPALTGLFALTCYTVIIRIQSLASIPLTQDFLAVYCPYEKEAWKAEEASRLQAHC